MLRLFFPCPRAVGWRDGEERKGIEVERTTYARLKVGVDGDAADFLCTPAGGVPVPCLKVVEGARSAVSSRGSRGGVDELCAMCYD